jgi:transposase
MGKAYTEEQRLSVKLLLESGRDEETIEKETGVSDRTIRRWKLELERTGRIGKPPESRTGRHRVLNADIEAVSLISTKLRRCQ